MLRGKFVPLTIQTSVKFCNFAELYLRSLKTYHFQIYFTLFTFKLLILRGTLFCGVDRFSLTGPYKKLKKPWTGLLCKPETHKELKRVTLICLLCPMLVIIHFQKYRIWNEKKKIPDQSNFVNNVTYFYFRFPRLLEKKWPINWGKTPKSRESFQRLKPGILPKHWAGYYCLTSQAKHNIMKPKLSL